MAEARKARVIGFNHVALEVGDIESALAFYGRLFDFKLRGKGDSMAFIDLGDQFIALQKGRSQPFDDGRHFGLVVNDKETARKALVDAGVEILPGPFLDFRDPWGNRIEIVGYDIFSSQGARRLARHGPGASLEERERTQGACGEGHGARVTEGACHRLSSTSNFNTGPSFHERRTRCFEPCSPAVTAASRPQAQAHYLLVVFGLVRLGDFVAVGGVNAAAAPTARVARVLAGTHLGMATAKRPYLLVKLDRRDRAILSGAFGANVNGAGGNGSGVDLVGDRRPIDRG